MAGTSTMTLQVAIALMAGLGLAACDENGQFNLGAGGEADASAPVASATSTQLVERDVEAPEVFQVTSSGLWDGRPSLGGVWVAHPDVTDPERVIIRNDANGKFVIGALFRRERENPGPDLQVSSDAAEALGMLAGAPTALNVTALRREEAAVEAPATDTAVTEFETAADIAATPLDPVAGAAAAIDAAETVASPAPVAAPSVPTPAPEAAPAATSSLDKPFIQIGIFSVEANANRTRDMLTADGMVAKVVAQQSQGKPFWRVVVGPAPTASDRDAILGKVKALGFNDAYFVSN